MIEEPEDTEDPHEADWGTRARLSTAFDPRLADVWLFLFGSDPDLVEQAGERLGWFLRMAYLRGYEDALREPRRGELYRRLGVPIPPRRAGSPMRPRMSRGDRT